MGKEPTKPKRKPRQPFIQVYLDKKKEWRWRCKFNGRILANSGEGYKRKNSMIRIIDRLFHGSWELKG